MPQAQTYKHVVMKASFILLASNILCSVLGYFRETLIVKNFGASSTSDAWYVAYSIPDVFLKFLLFGALGVTFVPVFIEYITQKREQEFWRVASTVINLSAILLGLAALAGVLFSSGIVFVFAPGLDPATRDLAVRLSRVLVPVIILIGLSGLLTSIYNAYLRFLVPSLATLCNAAMVVCVLFIFAPRSGVFAAVSATLAGYAAAFVILVLFLALTRPAYTVRIDLRHPALRVIAAAIVPLVGAEIIGKGIGITDRIFSSFLPSGSITALNLANRVIEMPTAFFSAAVAMAVFPVLSRHIASGDRENFSLMFEYSLKVSLLVMTPCVIGLLIVGRPLIQALFEHGKFGPQDTSRTWQALFFLSFGLLAFSIRPMLARACYALKRNWLLFRYELAGFLLNIALDYALMRWLGLAGIALATSIVVTLMTLYLIWMLRREQVTIRLDQMRTFLLKVLAASLCMGLCTHGVFSFLSRTFVLSGPRLLAAIAITAVTSMAAYAAFLKIFRTKELANLWELLQQTIQTS